MFIEVLRVMMRSSQVEIGCLYYRFSADLERPTTFYLTEEWDSEDALQAHFRAPHFADFVAQLGKHYVQRKTESRGGILAPYQLRPAGTP
jgi:quinol monooxygenase YgiN